MKGQFS